MKVLVLGNDGRAHALVWKLFADSQADALCGPGNGGTSQLAPQVDIDAENAVEIARWAFSEQVDLIIPASSAPLYAGLVDEVVSMHIGVCGPPQRSTRIEQSRCYAKDLLLRYKLPTTHGRCCADLATAEKYLASQQLPMVIKADRAAADDGIYHDRYAALEALQRIFAAHPLEGDGAGVVIEEFLPGVQISFSVITDGSAVIPLLPTRIYDRLDEGDQGPLVSGMGAYTTASAYARKLAEYLCHQVMQPLVKALQHEQLPYWGVLGIDCVITDKGPRITALRCSLRDLEAQVVLPRLEDDVLPLLEAAITRRLDKLPPLRWRDEASVGIGLVAQGYPHHFAVGGPVEGLTELDEGVLVFHSQTHNSAGMRYSIDHRHSSNPLAALLMGAGERDRSTITTTGGHVLTVAALAATLNGARGRALLNAERVTFPGRYFRGDIGQHETM